jgi:wyosine [tRNA(Phe)-imidazoG37] synthetase (radical SAM superfamily)
VLLTNGTLLLQPEVLTGISELDIVTVKFDAGDDDALHKINRPTVPFHHADLMAGIRSLRAQTTVTIALEVMLLQTTTGLSNIRGEARTYLLSALTRVSPHVDLIQLYTPWRPPSDSTVEALPKRTLLDFSQELSEEVGKEKLWIYGIHDARGKAAAWKVHKSLREELLTVLGRRPSRIADLTLTLGIPFHRILSELKNLQKTGNVNLQKYEGEIYYFYQEKG